MTIPAETMLRFFLKLGGGAVALRRATPPVLSSRQIRPGSAAPALPSQPRIFPRSLRPRVAKTPRPADPPFPSTARPSNFLCPFSPQSPFPLFISSPPPLQKSNHSKEAGDFSIKRAFNFVILSPRTLNKRNSCLYYYASNTWHNLL